MSHQSNKFAVAVLCFVSLLCGFGSFSSSAEAGNANWARNAESDMNGYNIYVCLTPGCTASKTPAMKQGGAGIADRSRGASVVDIAHWT